MTTIRTGLLLGILAITTAGFSQSAIAASLSGTVTGTDSGTLSPAMISVLHVPTGTYYSTVTLQDGSWVINNIPSGGPYKITATAAGFNGQEQSDISISGDGNLELNFLLTKLP